MRWRMNRQRISVEWLEDRTTPAVTIRFDYTYDTSGFFNALERRAALERAGSELTAGMRDDLAAIAPSGTNTWTALALRPDTGDQINLTNLTIPEGVVIVYPGARKLGGSTVGETSFIFPSESAEGSPEWQMLVQTRGQAGVLDATPTDTTLWGGSIWFDSLNEWYFGTDPAGSTGLTDFQSIAAHELIHLFGFSDSNPAFQRYVSGYTFTGPNAVAEYGGAVPTEERYLQNSVTKEFIRTAPSHWADDTMSRGAATAMQPAISGHSHVPISPLDFAALKDIGWDLHVPAVNMAPTVSDVGNVEIPFGGPGVSLPVTVGDALTAPANLVLSAKSSDPGLVPTLGGSGSNRAVTVTPTAGWAGTATVTLTVTDSGGLSATDTFVVTVPVPKARRTAKEFAIGSDLGSGTVQFYNADESPRYSVAPFGSDFTGGVRTAAADFTGDGIADLVVGTGPGGPTHVRVLDGVTQAELFHIDPFEAAFTGGVYVATGDITGDGRADLVITPDEGGGPRVRVFRGDGFTQVADFFGIDDSNFRGGARAAVGDINGDGTGDLVVAAGYGGGPRIAMFNGRTISDGTMTRLAGDFFAFEQSLRNGAYIAVGDIDGDGLAEIIAGGGPGGGPRVTAFGGAEMMAGRQTSEANFFGGDPNNRGGIRLAVKDLDGDARADLLTGSGPGGGSQVTGYRGIVLFQNPTPTELFTFESQLGSRNGVFVG